MQVVLVLLFIAAQTISIFDALESDQDQQFAQRILGFRSLDDVVVLMIAAIMLVIISFAALLVYQVVTAQPVRELRLVWSGEPPELSLFDGLKWHLFLSHIWSSGQDQVALIKQQLGLLVPGISVFLDVDDLEVRWQVPTS